MKKVLLWIAIFCLLLLAVGVFYFKSRGPKIVQGTAVLCKSVDEEGKPINEVKTFSSKDTSICVSAKFNKLFTKGVKVIWYKGDASVETRIKVDNNIKISKSNYAYSRLTIPEGFSEGEYTVNIYCANSDISETTLYFKVEK